MKTSTTAPATAIQNPAPWPVLGENAPAADPVAAGPYVAAASDGAEAVDAVPLSADAPRLAKMFVPIATGYTLGSPCGSGPRGTIWPMMMLRV